MMIIFKKYLLKQNNLLFVNIKNDLDNGNDEDIEFIPLTIIRSHKKR
jgi:hypothetical protein